MPETPSHAALEADFSDFYDRALPAARMAEVEAHLASCDRCRAEYRTFCETVGKVAGLGRVKAPSDFDTQVADTIHRRSEGRFFGRRAFGDRVPFELLAVLSLVAIVIAFALLRGR
jgi:anti-sigma factor RsiW